MKAVCVGLPGWMKFIFTWCSSAQSARRAEENSGLLSRRSRTGWPRVSAFPAHAPCFLRHIAVWLASIAAHAFTSCSHRLSRFGGLDLEFCHEYWPRHGGFFWEGYNLSTCPGSLNCFRYSIVGTGQAIDCSCCLRVVIFDFSGDTVGVGIERAEMSNE